MITPKNLKYVGKCPDCGGSRILFPLRDREGELQARSCSECIAYYSLTGWSN